MRACSLIAMSSNEGETVVNTACLCGHRSHIWARPKVLFTLRYISQHACLMDGFILAPSSAHNTSHGRVPPSGVCCSLGHYVILQIRITNSTQGRDVFRVKIFCFTEKCCMLVQCHIMTNDMWPFIRSASKYKGSRVNVGHMSAVWGHTLYGVMPLFSAAVG